jgi:nicotinamide-nucleotide amidase
LSDPVIKLARAVRAAAVAVSPPLTVAVAESLTCGRVQAALGAASGASDYFLGGLTAYTLEQKVKLLGVERRSARRVNCVSEEVARAMARGAATLFGARVAVATTGYAEPAAAAPEPYAWWALAARRPGGRWVERSGRVVCPGLSRVEVQTVVASAVLVELLAYLQQQG